VGVEGADTGIKGGVRNAIKMHDTLLKQVSLRFNSTIVSARGDTAQSRALLRGQLSAQGNQND
jgi:hypothetical protein